MPPIQSPSFTNTLSPKQRQFSDREEPQQLFREALDNLHKQKYSILAFHGVGGIGKSRLQEHLKSEHLDKDDRYLYSSVNFEQQQNRQPHQCLRTLARNFRQQACKIPLPAFELAYLLYWEKAFPDQEIKKSSLPFIEEGGLVSDAIATANEAGGVVSIGLRALEYAFKKIKETSFDKTIREQLKALQSFTAEKIEENLALFFAYDIQRYQAKHPDKKIVIFLDTYEALWGKVNRRQSNRLTEDKWLRKLVAGLERVLFVICGREKLVWQEDNEAWADYLQQHPIGDLSDNDARDFLQSCGIEDKEIQNRIIQDSEGVPYYLDLSVDTYERILQSGKTPSPDDFAVVGKHELFERFMKYLNDHEAATLKVLSLPRFYTGELMITLIDEFKTYYPITELDQLNAFSFIQQQQEDGETRYQLHDLMRKSLKGVQSDKQQQAINQFLFDYYNQQLQDLSPKSITEQHLQAFEEAFYHKQQLNDLEGLIHWWDGVYDQFTDAAKYNELLETGKILRQYIEQTLGEEHKQTAYIYNQLAYFYNAQGKYTEAEPLFQRSLTIKEKVLGEDHPDVATSLNNLAALYEAQGKYTEAEPLYQRSLAIDKKVFGDDYPDVAIDLNNLAALYKAQGKYTEAEPLYQHSLSMMEKVLGEDHPDVAQSLNNLAALYYAQGKYTEAEPLFQRSLAIWEKVLGEDHPNVAQSLNNLAALYEAQGKYTEAEPLYQRSLVIWEKVLGEDHPDVATSLSNLALLYYAQGKYTETEPLYQRSLAIDKKVFGEDHPNVASSLNNLAELYRVQDKYTEAEPLYQRSLAIREEVLGEDHPDVAQSLNNLALLYKTQGRYTEAEPLYLKAISILEKVFPEGHPNLDTCRNSLAVLREEMQ